MKREQPPLSTSLCEIFTYYLDTDKNTLHSYGEVYEKLFSPYRETATAVLEIGTRYGGSLRAWRDYFSIAQIYGLDSGEEDELWMPVNSKRIHVFGGDSTDPEVVDKFDGQFQIVIEDGSHKIDDQIKTFKNIWPLVEKGGLYICEDLEGLWAAEQFVKECGGEIIDLTHIKQRHDDLLVIVRR